MPPYPVIEYQGGAVMEQLVRRAMTQILVAAQNALTIEMIWEALGRGEELETCIEMGGIRYRVEGKLHPQRQVVMTMLN